MKLTSFVIATLLSCLCAHAVLPPQQCAPLGLHLQEVNKEWNHMWPEMATSTDIVQFENEADRIKLHLELVVKKLKSGALEKRELLLDQLNEYASKKVFPQNTILPYRNPVFIDEHNTACAVGHLMRVSGYEDLAARIDANMETYYIEQMKDEAIEKWAEEHHCSSAELAWIQPGYPPNTLWLTVGGGVNGEVDAAITLANDDVILAGNFDLGTAGTSTVARWDGTTYTAIGMPLPGEISDIIEYNSELYVAGAFYQLNAFYDHAKFDGSNWVLGQAFLGMTSAGTAFTEHNGELYLAGMSTGFPGVLHSVMKTDPQNGWIPVAMNTLNDTIRSLAFYEGSLYVGGDFTGSLGLNDTIKHVAVLDSTGLFVKAWDGLNAAVHDLEPFYGNLYVSGELGDMSNPAFGLAVLYLTDTSWTELLPNHESYMMPVNGENVIRDIEFIGFQLFAGGSFDIQPLLGTTGQNILWVDPGFGGNVLALASQNGKVNCLTPGIGSSFYIGGTFDTVNGSSNERFALSDFTIQSLGEQEMNSQLRLWPSPAQDILNVDRKGKVGAITILAADGRLVKQETLALSNSGIDISDLPQGSYFVKIEGSKQVGRFIVQR